MPILGPNYGGTPVQNTGLYGTMQAQNKPQRYTPAGGLIPNSGPITPPLSYLQGYPAGVEQQAKDYDELMGRFRNFADTAPQRNADIMGKFNELYSNAGKDYNPALINYSRDPDVAQSLASLKGLTDTGGYTEEGIADLRARGISPIRAAYANAQRDLDRRRAISGGYSPNAGYIASKMAREQSGLTAKAAQDVNANIAEAVASGRRAMAPQYASAAQAESGVAKDILAKNAAAQNRAKEFALGQKSDAAKILAELSRSGQGDIMDALKGMSSLYGTTPALVDTFGRQAMGAAQLQQQAKAERNRTGLDMISSYMRGRTRLGA